MEVCKHHKPFKELTSTQNGTPIVRYPPYLCKKTKTKTKKSSFSSNLCGITGVVWNP